LENLWEKGAVFHRILPIFRAFKGISKIISLFILRFPAQTGENRSTNNTFFHEEKGCFLKIHSLWKSI